MALNVELINLLIEILYTPIMFFKKNTIVRSQASSLLSESKIIFLFQAFMCEFWKFKQFVFPFSTYTVRNIQ